MSIFNRLQATIAASIDNAVSQVENHDAVVEAALKEARSAAAKARVRLSRVKKEEADMLRKLDDLQKMQQKWIDRALGCAQQDERQALECVQRRNSCQQQVAQTEEAIAQHQELAKKVSASVDRIEQRLMELTQQRNLMRSRNSAADALRVMSKIEGDYADGLDDTFERWEMRITESEYLAGNDITVDSLNESFSELENAEALKADLADLLNSTNKSSEE